MTESGGQNFPYTLSGRRKRHSSIALTAARRENRTVKNMSIIIQDFA